MTPTRESNGAQVCSDAGAQALSIRSSKPAIDPGWSGSPIFQPRPSSVEIALMS